MYSWKAWCLLAPMFLLFFAQDSYAQQRSPWALEATFSYNHQGYDYSMVNESVTSRRDFERESYPSRIYEEPTTIQPQWVPDLKLGIRYHNFHIGVVFSELKEQSVGYRSYYLNNQNLHFDEKEYQITTKSREYLVEVGFMQPLLPRLSLGFFGAAGWGIATGKYIDPFGPPGTTSVLAELEGDYTPMRLGGKIRYELTRYIDLEFGGGWRSSVADEMVADYGLVLGEYPVTVYSTSSPRITEFDWSGVFYGVGITLKQPYGNR